MRTPMVASAANVSVHCTQSGSRWTCRAPWVAGFAIQPGPFGSWLAYVSICMASAPALEQIDHDQHEERNREQHHRDGGRLGVAEAIRPVFLQAHHNKHRGDLGLKRRIARHE